MAPSSAKILRRLKFEDLLFEEDKYLTSGFENCLAIAKKLSKDFEGSTRGSKLFTTSDWKDLVSNLHSYRDEIEEISDFAANYDSVTRTKANGYRTFVGLSSALLLRLTKLMIDIQHSKGRLNNNHAKDLAAWCQAIKDLSVINKFLIEIHNDSKSGELFPTEPDVAEVEALAGRIARTDLSKFYGSLAAFYLRGDAQDTVKQVALALAMYSDIYTKTYVGMGFNFMTNFVKMVMYNFDSERVVKSLSSVVRDVPVEFCKSYYNFPESDVVSVFYSRHDAKVDVNHVITIPPIPIRAKTRRGKVIEIPIPKSYFGPRNLQARLIAPFRTKNMFGCKCRSSCICPRSDLQRPSESIFFHLHGGGFVSQTSKSHATYLKQWAVEWDMPIISIDYSLAPEAPYPRALEEVVLAYAWMRENFGRLGTSGKKVIVGGDSAGGNLSVGLFLKCVELDLPRPDCLFLFYPSLLCEMFPSPSRLICLIDPMVMFPFLMRCVNSYADPNYKSTCPRSFEDEVNGCKLYNDPLMSPLLVSPDLCPLFPPTHLFSTDVDPCLDETIAFSNKLVRGGASRVTLDVLAGFPHGFLNLNGLSTDCRVAVDLLTKKLKKLLP